MAAISVIIPVYNTCHFVGACIDSLRRQMFEDWEAIVINDGSTDASDSSINISIGNDLRFKVINTENQGLSCARNIGLKEASGEWILFLDSDDTLFPNALFILYSLAQKTSADIVISSMTLSSWKDSHNVSSIMSGMDYFCEAVRSGVYAPMVWGNLYRRCFLSLHGLTFNGRIFEDEEFTPRTLLKASFVYPCYEPIYQYNRRVGSLSSSCYSIQRAKVLCNIADSLKSFWIANTTNILEHEIAWKINLERLRYRSRDIYSTALQNDPVDSTLIIIAHENRSIKFGVGTYIDALARQLASNTDRWHIILLLLSNNVDSPRWEITDIGTQYTVPRQIHGLSREETADRIVCFLRSIGEGVQGSFHCLVNGSTDMPLVQAIKREFNASTVWTYHYPIWIEDALRLNLTLDGLKEYLAKYPCSELCYKVMAEKETALACDGLIVPSYTMFVIATNILGIAPENIHVIPHGIRNETKTFRHITEKQNIRVKYGIDNDDFVILYYGRIDNIKGVSELIDSLKTLNSIRKIRLIIAGNGSFDIIMSKTHNNLLPNISFFGVASNNELKELCYLSDIGIVPSYFESFGYSMLEMLCCGLDVVARSTSGLREIAKNFTDQVYLFEDSDSLGYTFCKSLCGNLTERHPDLRNVLEYILTSSSHNNEVRVAYVPEFYDLQKWANNTVRVLTLN